MGQADFLELGSWNFSCYMCGRKCKSSRARRNWQGFYVCDRPGCWEPRQPQDFARGTKDTQQPPWTQPEPAPQFVDDAPETPIPDPSEYPLNEH